MLELQIEKRNGLIEDYSVDKIIAVIQEINNGLEKPLLLSDELFGMLEDDIEQELLEQETSLITTKELNDIVWQLFLKYDLFDIAKIYIINSHEKDKKEEKRQLRDQLKFDNNELYVTKRDGTKEKFSMEKISDIYDTVAVGLKRHCKIKDFLTEVRKFIVNNVKTTDMYDILIKAAINNIDVNNTKWNLIAGRLQTLKTYKLAAINRKIDDTNHKIYSAKNFLDLIKEYTKKGLYDNRFLEIYGEKALLKAGSAIKSKRDMDYNYSTSYMLSKRYLLNPNNVIKELPQEMYMLVALFLALPEKEEDRLDFAIKIYEATSTQKISLPTPTLLNARTKEHQLSSCFITHVNDDLRDIYHQIDNMAQISKNAGGLGSYWGDVRSKGGSIRGVEGVSGGVLPWLKVVNDTAISCNQLGSRKGSISTTLDIFHADIFDFLDMQTETGDIRRKSFDIFPAVSISDLFMKRMINNEDFTLFCPHEVNKITGKKLQDFFGEEHEKFYIECEKNTKLKLKQTVKAKDLFKRLLKSVVETGMPYIFFRDTVNNVNPNKHAGNIYSSNLCTEIAQNMSPGKFVSEESEGNKVKVEYEMGDMVTCNLASINIAKVNKESDIKENMNIITRLLDNVIILNKFPVEEAKYTSEKYRSIGIGYMGLAEYLACNQKTYEKEEDQKHIHEMFERFAYYTYYYSNKLAEERGKYPLFDGSEWSKGIINGKDEEWFINNSKIAKKWGKLISNIKEKGMRFGYHTSPAPNTSTGQLVGTTAGLVPIYKKFFTETNSKGSIVNVAPNLDESNFWHYKEYVNMKMPPVIDMISGIQEWVDQSISFEWIINPETTSPAELYQNYIHAWKKRIKTVYYVRSMSLNVDKGCESCAG